MVFDDGFFADPVQCGHGLFVIAFNDRFASVGKVMLRDFHNCSP